VRSINKQVALDSSHAYARTRITAIPASGLLKMWPTSPLPGRVAELPPVIVPEDPQRLGDSQPHEPRPGLRWRGLDARL